VGESEAEVEVEVDFVVAEEGSLARDVEVEAGGALLSLLVERDLRVKTDERRDLRVVFGGGESMLIMQLGGEGRSELI